MVAAEDHCQDEEEKERAEGNCQGPEACSEEACSEEACSSSIEKIEQKKQKETLVTPENKKGSCKVSFKKRKCDSAYHSAKKRAKKDGKSLEEACAAGSAAAAKMAAEIDAGLVTDPNL